AMSEDQLALFRRDHIGIVFQAFRLVPTMTAVENVAIPLEFAGHTAPFEAARAALAKVKLDHRLHHYPDQLSGGEQQRVAIARAFVVGPKLLLADEPTGNLDGATGETVIDLLFELQALHGATLCLITHDSALAARCARTISLADGCIAEDSRRSDAA
ncbi:MAG: ATP-binding cassette domain-containing protein, partial [Pseudomonadota bacterium]|nr:ATP-binding cassette domain-containing protein [Pseudomonadota bacterium]